METVTETNTWEDVMNPPGLSFTHLERICLEDTGAGFYHLKET